MRATALLAPLLLTACGLATEQTVGTRHASLPAADLALLDLDLERGDLRVVGSPDATELTVEVEVRTAVHHSAARSAEVTERLRLDLAPVGEGVATLDIALPDDAATYTLDVTVHLPARLAVELTTGSGDLLATDLAGVALLDEGGDVELARVDGPVRIQDAEGDMWLTDLRGAVELRDDSGDVHLARVEGEVQVQDGSGDVTVQDVQGAVLVVDDSGDLVLEYVAGDVDVDDGAGDLRVAHVAGTVSIVDGSGDIVLEDVDAWELLADDSGDVITR